MDLDVFCEHQGVWRSATILEILKWDKCPIAFPPPKVDPNWVPKPPKPKLPKGVPAPVPTGPVVVDSGYQLDTHEYVYYVHFASFDRRMDEWLDRTRVALTKDELPAGSELEEAVEDPHAHGHGPFTHAELDAHEKATKVKNINKMMIGPYLMETWYHSPFPEEYKDTDVLHFCDFCLSFFVSPAELARHRQRCLLRQPPGIEIYRSEEHNVNVCMFEVDGTKEAQYCQNLCYIAKLFLDHKTLQEDTTIFLFYVLCEYDEYGCHPVGYFSKEKVWSQNNLACILTLPCHQRKGYGSFLISMSYELSKIERKQGSPERPLSDLGRCGYISYWTKVLIKELKRLLDEHNRNKQLMAGGASSALGDAGEAADVVSIQGLSKVTGITPLDVQDALKEHNILVCYKGKWAFSLTNLEHQLKRHEEKAAKYAARLAANPGMISVHPARPEKIHWTPYLTSKRAKRTEQGGYGAGAHS